MADASVLVIGAGPTGLTLAASMRRSGIEVRVLDAADGPATTSRALGLQPRGVEVLDRLGALGGLPERSLRIREVVIVVAGRELARLKVGQRTRLGGHPALMMGQTEVEGALRQRLAAEGGEVRWGARVAGIDSDAGGVTVRLAGGGSERTSWLVGCDGAHSAVRKAAGIGFPGVPLVERFLIADVRADLGLPRDSVTVWLHGADMLAAFPLPGVDLWRIMTPAGSDVAEPGPAEVLAAVRERVAAETGCAVRSAEWTSTFRIHRRLAETYRRGRVLLAGDAAHVHSPLGGQGMNTGIGDAENLAWKLAMVLDGRACEGLLDTYEAERRPVAQEVLGATSGLTNLLFGDGTVARFLRDRLVVPVMDRPFVQRQIAERSSQLLVSYRGGPLGDGRRWRRGLRAGDRVADVPCRRPDGSVTRLHAELGRSWAVLAPSGSDLVPVARLWLGEVVHLVGDVPDTWLVRPDGHLGWRGTDAAGLRAWLRGASARPAPTPAGQGMLSA